MTTTPAGKGNSTKLKSVGDHDEFLNRITKSLYYSKLPMTDCLSFPVTELAAELFTEVKSGRTLERLDIEEASRISRNACVSPCSLVLALLYLERLKDCNPEYLRRVAPPELFLVSLMVASKFLHDDGEEDEVFNAEWAQSGDLSLSQMNQLEKDFLQAIDWAVFVRDQDFWEKLRRLEKDVAYKQAQKRGWFSYMELCCLMNAQQLIAVAHMIINVSSICLATYAAGIATLLGSALIASHLPGTVLGPRQTTVSSNISSVAGLNLLHETEPVVPANLTHTLTECNKTCVGRENQEHKVERKRGNTSWEWWLDSVMTWLPQYSGLESINIDLPVEDAKLESKSFDSSTKYFFDSTPLLQDTDNSAAVETNWKEILGLDVEFPLNDWRYYIRYSSEITLSSQH